MLLGVCEQKSGSMKGGSGTCRDSDRKKDICEIKLLCMDIASFFFMCKKTL